MSRRRMLGTLGGAVGFGSLLQPAIAAEIKKQHKQVCLIWLDGGMSQYESWHPLPDSQFGGPFRSIKTSIPGVHFSELLPETAKIAHKISVIRTMETKGPNHSTGVPRIQRGDPIDRGVTYPYLGSAIAKLLGPANPELPPYLWIKPGNGGFIAKEAGFLGARYGTLALGDADELLARPTAWLFGNEAWGLPDDLAAAADHRVAIPIHGKAESLNLSTAAALCLYASARVQR